jgi:hypothetical protein
MGSGIGAQQLNLSDSDQEIGYVSARCALGGGD